jgi:hypothetical protein
MSCKGVQSKRPHPACLLATFLIKVSLEIRSTIVTNAPWWFLPITVSISRPPGMKEVRQRVRS